MSDPLAIRALQEMIREELQLGWSHVEDGNDDLAAHHFRSAAEKVEQIKQLKGDCAAGIANERSTQLLTINNDPTQGN
jgi:hypothetical protein